MITPFRIIKNKFIREKKSLKVQELYFHHFFINMMYIVEKHFHERFELDNEIIKKHKIKEYIEVFFNIHSLKDYIKHFDLISENYKNPYVYDIHLNDVDKFFLEIKNNMTKEQVRKCFNLTPIREPEFS